MIYRLFARSLWLQFSWLLCFCLFSHCRAQSSPAEARVDPKQAKIIEFPIQAGSIDGEQFYQRVISQLHWTTELSTKLVTELKQPTTGFNVNGRVPMNTLNVLSNSWPDAFQIVSAPANNRSDDIFRVNMTELESQWSQQKLSLRRWLASRSNSPLYEVCGNAGFNGRTEKKRLVIVLGGLHGGVGAAMDVAKALHNATGVAACAFNYPNDAPLDESADYFHQVLRQLHAELPAAKIIVVTHSMGGLVARSVIERRVQNDPKCLGVSKFIAICPPNEGSIFAEYAGVLEGAELLQRLTQTRAKRPLLATVLDGFNEAPKELVPGSEFLNKLNEAKRHPAVQYSIIAGDAGMIDPGLSQLGNDILGLIASRFSEAKSLQERADKLLNSAEFQKGSGDGVVTLQSAKLKGVSDVKILPINHLNWSELDKSEGKQILQEVVARIGIEM